MLPQSLSDGLPVEITWPLVPRCVGEASKCTSSQHADDNGTKFGGSSSEKETP